MSASQSDYSTRWVLALLSAVVFLAVVNGTMINIALPYVGADFGVSEGTYGWVVTGYSLAFGIFNAVDGRLADVLGIRRLYMFGILIFGATALAIALAPTIEFTIALRVMQGAGAAALPVLGSTIIARLIPASERGAAMGVILSTVGVAASIGPFLGGFIVQIGGWRWVFGLTAVVLFALPFAFRLLPRSLDETEGGHFDVVGAILLSAGVATLMYGFEIVESRGFDPVLALCVGGGLVLLFAFGWWIRRVERPFAAPELFGDFRYVGTCTIAFLTNATRFGTIVLVPIFLTEVNDLEPVWIGAVLFPGAAIIAVVSRRAGTIADAVGPRVPVGWGAAFIVLGNLVTAYFAGGSPWGVGAGMGLYGLGFALIQTPLVSTASQLAPEDQTGVAMGIFMMIFFVGGAFGVALSVTTTELQPADAASWVGLDLGAGALFSNAILMLTALAVTSALLVPVLPGDPTDSEGRERLAHEV